jgi:hypothetical protein
MKPTKLLLAAASVLLAAASVPARGAVDLLANGLADWSRHAFSPRPVSEKSPWSYDAKTGVLRCDATKDDHEMLLHKTPFADGVLTVEYRYVGNPAKNNSGVFIRTAPDYKTGGWLQAQLATTGLGMLFGDEPAPGAEKPRRRVSAGARHPELQKPAGEWNTIELAARGPEITLSVNGRQVAVLKNFGVLDGHVGIEAEFYPVEFRNLRYQPLPCAFH